MGTDNHVIILVDDDTTCLAIGKAILGNKYILYLADSGEKFFDITSKVKPDLILLDIEMPVMNGYEVMRRLKENDDMNNVPVIFLTAMADPGSELEGLTMGAIDYVTKPFSAPLLLKRIENHLLMASQRNELRRYNQNLREMVSVQTHEIKHLQNGILGVVAEIVESRSDMSAGHIQRITEYVRLMTEALKDGPYQKDAAGWDKEFFYPAAELHDLGKIYIKEEILNKPGKLTPEEFNEIKNHPAYGLAIIDKMCGIIGKHPFLTYARLFAEQHHERWDGKGYPAGLSGADISLPGRIMALADMYDALISVRPYKQAWTTQDAAEEIKKHSGTAFDPELVKVFTGIADEFAKIATSSHA